MADQANEPQLERLELLWESDPSSKVYLELAEAYREADRTDDAIRVLETSLQHRPRDPRGRVALARCRLDQHDPSAAADLLEEVTRQDPAHVQANKLLLEAHLRRGDADKAEERLNIYRLLNDRDPELDHLEYRLEGLRSNVAAAEEAEADAPLAGEPTPTEMVETLAAEAEIETPLLESAAPASAPDAADGTEEGDAAPASGADLENAADLETAADLEAAADDLGGAAIELPAATVAAEPAFAGGGDDIFDLGPPPPPPSLDALFDLGPTLRPAPTLDALWASTGADVTPDTPADAADTAADTATGTAAGDSDSVALPAVEAGGATIDELAVDEPVSGEDATVEEFALEEAPADEDAAFEEAPPVEPAAEDVAAEDVAAEDVAAEEVAAESAPDEETATVTLGALYLSQGHRDEAERIFRRVLEEDPGNYAASAALRRLAALDDEAAESPGEPESADREPAVAAHTAPPAPEPMERAAEDAHIRVADPAADDVAPDEDPAAEGASAEPTDVAAAEPTDITARDAADGDASQSPVEAEAEHDPADGLDPDDESWSLEASHLLADRSLTGVVPEGLTAKKILVLNQYIHHLRTAARHHVR